MTSQEIATRATALDLPDRGSLSDTMEVVRAISATDFVPRTIRGNNASILACILYGREIGLGPMESLSEVHMIDGRPSLSAKAKVKRARQIGHDIWGEVDDKKAVVHGKRGDNGREMTVTFTIEQAKTAGLTGKTNWKSYAEDMLWARAVSRLCRRLFTEDGMLTTYDPDEVEQIAEAEHVADVLGDLPQVPVDEFVDAELAELAEESETGDSGGVPSFAADSPPESSSADSFTELARKKGLVGEQGELA